MKNILFLIFLFSYKVVAQPTFLAACKYPTDDSFFSKGTILGLMYPQLEHGLHTMYVFELRNGKYIELGRGSPTGGTFNGAKTKTKEEGYTQFLKTRAIIEHLQREPFLLISLPKDKNELKPNADKSCVLNIKNT